MTLNVSFSDFSQTIQRELKNPRVYVAYSGRTALITAADASNDLVVCAETHESREVVEKKLKEAKVEFFNGSWLPLPEPRGTEPYVAAIAYRSGEDRPGLWLEAFPEAPTEVDVIKAFMDEMKATGEMPDATMDDFVKMASPNVIVLSPAEVQAFAQNRAR
ncbi:MAG: hypothetical protein JSS72_04835 [Armatimonadetes bacterium]|nr:hypothetical protein [Armatimonadota bacterium]